MASRITGLGNLRQVLLEPADRKRCTRRSSSAARAGSRLRGPLVVNTGKHTARAAQDKFIVREADTEEHIWWGEYNRPYQRGQVQRAVQPAAGLSAGARSVRAGLLRRAPIRNTACRCASSPSTPGTACLPAICSSCPRAATNTASTSRNSRVICVPSFKGFPAIDGTRIQHVHRCSTSTSGCASSATRPTAARSRKSIFTVMNYLLPLEGVMTMHCSANAGRQRRHGAVLRPVGHGQDHALRRSQPRSDRRRRARLERRGRLQLRGRLLRQGDRAFALSAEPEIYAARTASAPFWRTWSTIR